MKNIKGKNMRRTLAAAATRTNLPAVILTTIIAELQR